MDEIVISPDDFDVSCPHVEGDSEPLEPFAIQAAATWLASVPDPAGAVERLGQLIARHEAAGYPVARDNAERVRTALLAEIRRHAN